MSETVERDSLRTPGAYFVTEGTTINKQIRSCVISVSAKYSAENKAADKK